MASVARRATRGGIAHSLRSALVRTARPAAVTAARAWLDWAVAAAERGARPRTRIVGSAASPGTRPIRFLILNAWGVGGTVRTTYNTADYLAGTHDVEVVSALRKRDVAGLPIPAGLRLRALDDRRKAAHGPGSIASRLLRRAPSRLWHPHDAAYRQASLWTDVMLVRFLRGLPRGSVLFATRPALVLLATRLAPAGVVVIAQEHQRLALYDPELREAVRKALPNASLMVTLTEQDRGDYGALLGAGGPPVLAIPNAVPQVPLGPADPDAHRLIAAGRLVSQKGFDLLLRAFASLAPQHPDWSLDIFGRGPERVALEALIERLGLVDRAHVNQPTDRLGERMRDASVYVLSSRHEGFPMILLEAMAAGLAVVAFDCPTGPNEMIADGENGLLVPPEDVEALASALDRVMTDAALRRRLAAAAPTAVGRYRLPIVGRRWAALLDRPEAVGRAIPLARRKRAPGGIEPGSRPQSA